MSNTTEDAQGVKLTLRIPAEIHAAIKASARRNRRSLNGEIVRALEEYAARQAEQAERKGEAE